MREIIQYLKDNYGNARPDILMIKESQTVINNITGTILGVVLWAIIIAIFIRTAADIFVANSQSMRLRVIEQAGSKKLIPIASKDMEKVILEDKLGFDVFKQYLIYRSTSFIFMVVIIAILSTPLFTIIRNILSDIILSVATNLQI